MITSKTYHGVRDWSVKSKRSGDRIEVTVKVGTMLHSYIVLSASTWPKNPYDKQQSAIKATVEAIGVKYEDWESCEFDRIPDEIVKAVNEVT
jgi:hypothetical protein